MSNRVACAYIPNFPIRVVHKYHPTTVGRPLALTDDDRPKAPIVALNESAFRWGVRKDITRAQAKSLCPNLEIVIRDKGGEVDVSNSVLRALQKVAPNIEEEEPGLYFIDTDGLALLYKSERVLARKIIASIRYLMLPSKVGIAKNKFLARVAAEVSKISEFTVVTAGTERKFLSGLPSGYLRMTDEIREKLAELGIETIGEVSKFRHNDMTLRFGEEGSRLSTNANAEDLNLFSPEHFPETFTRRSQHLYTIFGTVQILKHIEILLDELFAKMLKSGRATARVQVRLRLENRNEVYLKAAVRSPTVNTAKFLRQLENELTKTKFDSGVSEVMVTIPAAVTQFSDQIDISSRTFTRTNPLANIDSSRIPNSGKLFLPTLSDSYLPEKSFSLYPFPADTKGSKRVRAVTKQPRHPYSKSLISGLRLLQPAQETKIISDGTSPGAMVVEKKRRKIAKQSGPWRISGGWWENDFDRLYYEVETNDRKQYLLYYDNILSRWFIHGIYD